MGDTVAEARERKSSSPCLEVQLPALVRRIKADRAILSVHIPKAIRESQDTVRLFTLGGAKAASCEKLSSETNADLWSQAAALEALPSIVRSRWRWR